jgi:predicted ATPase
MSYNKIEIIGLRGYSNKQTLNLAIPNGKEGSGLTCIVGPNNSGKSTIYESFRAISQNNPPSFTEGRRNKVAGDRAEIKLSKNDGTSIELKTTVNGGSETSFHESGLNKNSVKILTLPSRRTFSPFFSKSSWSRDQYISSSELSAVRGSQFDSFAYRLFTIQQNQGAFNAVLGKVLGNVPSWVIEQSDSGNYYLKFNYNGAFHNSDGTGEGLLSVFTIVDTLYDSNNNDFIVIDEPELSLHPSLQRKLMQLILEYSATRQIVISTHSPYFISWTSLANGGKISRTVKESAGTKIYELQQATATAILSLVNNLNNPHILGLDAREIFFLDDKIILVEGQEDVIFLNLVFNQIGNQLNGDFYGWGVGGADNTDKVVTMLSDLGFKKVAVIFDNNKRQLIPNLQQRFQPYLFKNIPTDDVRDKPNMNIEGLIDYGGKTINKKHIDAINQLCAEVNAYLAS